MWLLHFQKYVGQSNISGSQCTDFFDFRRLHNNNKNIYFRSIRVFDTEKGQSVMQRQVQLVERIKQIEQSIFDKWAHAIPADIHLHTAQHLLKRSDEGQLCVNFNEKVWYVGQGHVEDSACLSFTPSKSGCIFSSDIRLHRMIRTRVLLHPIPSSVQICRIRQRKTQYVLKFELAIL